MRNPPTSRQPLAMPGAALLALSVLLLCGCKTTVNLKDAVLAACGTNTVYLSDWWAGVPDKANIQNDPIGGYQMLYWIDDAGNACHGDPGRNGQVGPASVVAFRSQARAAAQTQAAVTDAQLKDFQEIPVSLAYYSGSGPHFVQFDNVIWRTRADRKTFQTNSSGVMSVPAVVDIGTRSCTAPVAFKVAQVLFLPSVLPSSTQDPDRCKVRAKPGVGTMSEADLKAVDVLSLPHGTELFEVP